ncbi:Na+/H+ antiporter family protein [Citricoccus muralis]|uniref:Na+/H+ antiporter NhaC family protein n=1 Tax=Citricoccus muralis TaxID=169134 RepID=A0ABY8H5I5_9MICC|nr:Na+/H+ antiporter NhaC family protein [Citricoccus muralis]WFP15912.1 Na+/H+ antiporter NhaC family protein [Citricoccus muralis]
MNSVVIAVLVMLGLALSRVHVVIALFIGAVAGGLVAGLGLDATMLAFQGGLGDGAKIALSYGLLGAFAMAVASSGLPQALANSLIRRLDSSSERASDRTVTVTKYALAGGVLLMSVASQNLIPVHIAFIPLLIPPLLSVMNQLRIDRRLIACILTFGLVTTYMYIPLGFGKIFLEDILMGNIASAGMETEGINVMDAMGIPALGMMAGLLVAVFVSYRKPRDYADLPLVSGNVGQPEESSRYRMIVSVVAILCCFGIQLTLTLSGSEADGLLLGTLVGLAIFLVTGAVRWRAADDVFTQGMRMMAMIGFIMITAQGFAAVMAETGDVANLVTATESIFGHNKPMAAFAMLAVGLLVTMGIGSSFSTLPIITTIYVPLCLALGFSPLATVSIIGTAGALGDAGSPASDSTLGPTAGLNADGQHDHIRDSVIPTFLHFNLPLLGAGWVASLVL